MNNLNVVIASRMLNIMVNREETLVHAFTCISDQNTRGRLETAVQIFAPIEMYLKLAQSNSFFLSDVYHSVEGVHHIAEGIQQHHQINSSIEIFYPTKREVSLGFLKTRLSCAGLCFEPTLW
jgi:hypothetical protein